MRGYSTRSCFRNKVLNRLGGFLQPTDVVVDVEEDGDSTAFGLALEAGPALGGIRHEEVVVREAERGGRLGKMGEMCGSMCGSMCEAPGEVDGMGTTWGGQ